MFLLNPRVVGLPAHLTTCCIGLHQTWSCSSFNNPIAIAFCDRQASNVKFIENIDDMTALPQRFYRLFPYIGLYRQTFRMRHTEIK